MVKKPQRATFSGWPGTDRFDLDSVDLSVVSVEALDKVLGPLLRRIEIQFLSATGLAILDEHFAFPPDCVCCGILHRRLHPPPT
jgi:hypothetical protein